MNNFDQEFKKLIARIVNVIKHDRQYQITTFSLANKLCKSTSIPNELSRCYMATYEHQVYNAFLKNAKLENALLNLSTLYNKKEKNKYSNISPKQKKAIEENFIILIDHTINESERVAKDNFMRMLKNWNESFQRNHTNTGQCVATIISNRSQMKMTKQRLEELKKISIKLHKQKLQFLQHTATRSNNTFWQEPVTLANSQMNNSQKQTFAIAFTHQIAQASVEDNTFYSFLHASLLDDSVQPNIFKVMAKNLMLYFIGDDIVNNVKQLSTYYSAQKTRQETVTNLTKATTSYQKNEDNISGYIDKIDAGLELLASEKLQIVKAEAENFTITLAC